MYFQQFYLGCLSHASYMIGSGGVAAVIDPRRDAGVYLEEAWKQDLSIDHVIETHLHADFVSGHRELAALTGANIYIGASAGAEFPHVPVGDGDELAFGRCVLKFIETPGHSIDSVSVLVTDLDRSAEPFAVLTGDTLFIGDVGRPDLSTGRSPREMAALLYRSLHRKLLSLPDKVEVYPAHGAGSLCGRQLGWDRSSTIGREKNTNYALRPASEEEFIRLVTSELPERPDHFALDKEINRAGPRLLSELPTQPPLRPDEVLTEQEKGAVVLDTRPTADFAAAHLPRSVHIGLSGQFAPWAAALCGLQKRLVIVAQNEDRVVETRIRLARVGIERVVGYLADGIAGWAREGLELEQLDQIPAADLCRLLSTDNEPIQLVDVRRPAEWDDAHIRSAVLMPLHTLPARLRELDLRQPVAVLCRGGYRSAIAASLLLRAGFASVLNVIGGLDAWLACNLPVVRTRMVGA